jgi:hypothetical protein
VDRSLRAARRFAGHPWKLSELAGALATLELRHGSRRNAQRLAEVALICPTENAWAQLNWLRSKNHLPASFSLARSYVPPASFEARMLECMREQQFGQAFESAIQWTRFEPYSERAAMNATFIGCVELDDFSSVEGLANTALIANPKSFVLKNNLAFALASNGKVDEARGVVEQMRTLAHTTWEKATLLAADGLIAFRDLQFEIGRGYYERSVDQFVRLEDRYSEALARIYWAREELRAGSTGRLGLRDSAVALARTVGLGRAGVVSSLLAGDQVTR